MSYVVREIELEQLIIDYQKSSDQKQKNIIYDKIYNIYSPQNYQTVWYRQYHYLYDTYNEFVSDYYFMFLKSLSCWKPRNLRQDSQYNGKGEFKNFFWSILKNHFSNIIKSKHSGKRNIKSRCPICEIWVQSLSLHLIETHKDLLWKYISNITSIDSIKNKCPFCPKMRIPKAAVNDIQNFIRNHICKNHISFLFEQFNEEYPGYLDNQKNISLNALAEYKGHDEEFDITDLMKNSKQDPVQTLMDCELTEIQKKIIFNALSNKRKILYNKKIYTCTKDKFDIEFNDLKTKMMICGFQTQEEEEMI